MNYKVIFCDVDGVLVDSENVFNKCWRKAAAQEGYSMSFEQALLLRSLDSTLAKELFLSWYGNDDAYSAIRAKRKTIMASLTVESPLMPKNGVLDFLKCVEIVPIKTAIVTSSPVSRITTYLSSVGIDIASFDKVITTEQVKRGKPFPDVYQYACEVMGYQPDECIAVEDSPNGVKSAHAAGCYTIMVPDLSPYQTDLRPFVDRVCNNIIDILPILPK